MKNCLPSKVNPIIIDLMKHIFEKYLVHLSIILIYYNSCFLSDQMNEDLKEESSSSGSIIVKIKRFLRKELSIGKYSLI